MNRYYQTRLMVLLLGTALLGGACNSQNELGNTPGGGTSASPMATASASPDDTRGMMHGNGQSGAMVSSPNAASAPYDLQFIDTMSAHHQGAIQMAQQALAKAQHNELKEIARKSILDQQREIQQMQSWREQWYGRNAAALNTALPGMNSMQGMDMSQMESAQGAAFDQAFLSMMVPHHQGAIALAQDAMSRAEHPEVKQLARQIVTAQQAEINTMNNWKASWQNR